MKKGAFSLSVNAIVVLILAIIMLGLGISFVRNMFGQASQSFEELISEEPEPVTPTIRSPISLSREHIITNSGKIEVVKVSILNPLHFDWGGPTISLSTTTHCNVHEDNVCYVQTGGTCTSLADDNDCNHLDDDPCSIYDGICYYNENDASCGYWSGPSFFTNDLNCVSPAAFPSLNCTGLDLWSIRYQALPKNIESSSYKTTNVIFEIPNAPAGTYLCLAAIWPYNKYITDFTIRIDQT